MTRDNGRERGSGEADVRSRISVRGRNSNRERGKFRGRSRQGQGTGSTDMEELHRRGRRVDAQTGEGAAVAGGSRRGSKGEGE